MVTVPDQQLFSYVREQRNSFSMQSKFWRWLFKANTGHSESS